MNRKINCTMFGILLSFAMAAASPFRDGERVVFLGDSITAQGAGGYIACLSTIYQSRYPGKTVRLYCAGVPGDTAGGGLKRLERDVLCRKPNRVFVWFGGNDLRYTLYAEGKQELSDKQRREMAVCQKNLLQIYDRLKAAGITVVAVTPTPFHYFHGEKNNYNEAGLAKLSDFIRKTAAERNMECIDLYQAMTEVLKRQPDIETYRKDKIHPDALGQLMIAYFILKQMNFDGMISNVQIDAANASVIKAQQAKIGNLKKTKTGIKFTYAPVRLPFYFTNKIHEQIDTLVPFTREMNSEILSATGLEPGKYQLKNGKTVLGRFSADELAQGINLAGLRTPSYLTARKIAGTSSKLGNVQGKLRNVAKGDSLIGYDRIPKGLEERAKAIDEIAAKMNSKYYYNVAKSYKVNIRNIDRLEKEMEQLMDQLSSECAPKPFELTLEKLDK